MNHLQINKMIMLRKYWSVATVLCLGAILSISAYLAVDSAENLSLESEFIEAANDRIKAIQNEWLRHLDVLEALVTFYAASTEVTRADFDLFTKPLLARHPDIEALYWLPRISHAQRAQWEKALQMEYPNALITEYNTQAKQIAAAQRAQYFPIYYVASSTDKKHTIGMDMGHDPLLGPVLQQVDERGEIMASGRFTLATTPEHFGIKVVYPVYTQTALTPRQLHGFIVGTFNIGKTVEHVLQIISHKGIDILLFDESAPPDSRFLYFHPSRQRRPPMSFAEFEQTAPSALQHSKNLKIAGRTWSIQCYAIPDYAPADRARLSVTILMGGLIFTVLILAFLLVLIERASTLQKMASELEMKKEEFRSFVNYAPVMLWMTDADGISLMLNQTWLDFTGTTPQKEGVTQTWTAFIHPDDSKNCLETYTQAFLNNHHKDFKISYRVKRSDGEYRCLSETITARFDSTGKFAGFIGAGIDITERKEMEQQLKIREEEFRTFINHAPVMLWISDAKGRYILFNQTWLNFTGRTLAEELAQDWANTIHPDDLEHYQYVYDNALKNHEDFKRVYRFRHADGTYRWISETTTTRFDVNGKFLGFIGACIDITQQKQAQQAVYESRRKLETLMSNLPGMAYRCCHDAYWTMEFVSEGCTELTGYKPIQIINNKEIAFVDLIHPNDYERVSKNVQTACDAHQPYKFDYRLLTLGGEEKWVWEQGQGIFSSTGELQALEGFIIDITDKKRAESALNRVKRMAEDANLAKSQFLANMSHELRTPLNAILGYSEMLQEEAEDLEQEDFIPDLKKIQAAGKHLLNIINDILDISRIEAGKMELYTEDFALKPLIEDVVNTIQPLVQEKQNILEVRCDDNLGTIHADLIKVRQIMLNLLSNAAKFTTQGHLTLEAWRESSLAGIQEFSSAGKKEFSQSGEHESSDWVILKVSDTGIGITPEQQGKLFQIFMQADASTTRKYGGTGLGLAITHQFIQMMHGTIHVDSVFGEGSTFTVHLPAHVDAGTAQPNKPVATTSPAIPAKDGKVLVIDDEEGVRTLLNNYLTRMGYQVFLASTGEDGLNLAKQERPHAIILDIMMPDMDGWTVLSILKADSQLADIPVIIVSMVEDKNTGSKLGATDYLVKPVSREQLVAVLRKYHIGITASQVLVVEDDTPTREMVGRMLTKAGCQVYEAENGLIALQVIEKQKPDLILLDLMMPKMDGFEFIKRLRQHSNWASIPVIVLTAKDITAEERVQLYGYVQTLFQKSAYHRDKLLAEVHKLLTATSKK
jgi:PAS domain S-box-containing protein